MSKPNQTVEAKRDRSFKSAVIEARNLMAQGFEIRITQSRAIEFKVYGRKAVNR